MALLFTRPFRFRDDDFPCFPAISLACTLYASLYARRVARRPRNDVCEFCSRDAPQPSGTFLPPLSSCFFLCSSGARKCAGVRKVSSRHDDECRNVRLEARNSMVCSLRTRMPWASLVYTTNTLLWDSSKAQGLRDFASTPFSRVLSRVRWIYSRSISCDFLPVNLRPLRPRRRDGSRRTVRHASVSLRRGAVWCSGGKFACVSSGKRSTRRWR